MRVDIDQQDIVNALADMRKKFDRATAGLIASLSITAALIGAAGFGLWRAGSTILTSAPAMSLADLAQAWRAEPQPFYMALGFTALLVAAMATAAGIINARRKRGHARKQEALNHSLGAGRFEFTFSAEKLTIAGPLAVKKISWQSLRAIEQRKSSIVFTHKDGTYDFIPRNIVPNDNFYDLMMVKHGPLLNKPCPYEEAHLAKPLSVTYETARGDLDDYYAHYFRKRDGRLYLLRALFQWRPLVPFLFLVLAALACALGYRAFQAYDLILAGAAIASALVAGAVFVMNGRYFRGPAHPFRKNETWPFAQSNLATVSLAKEGVFHSRHGATDIIKWAAFSGYVESKLYGYLVIAPKQVIALPKRSFLNKAHFDDFTLYAKRSISQAKQQRSDEKRGRMMRSLPDKNAVKQLPAPKPQAATARPSAPVKAAPPKPVGPSPKAAPAQVTPTPAAKPAPAPATKPVQAAKPAPIAKKPMQKKAVPQQAAPVKEQLDQAPAQPPAPAKKSAPEPSASTLAILNSALEKAAQLDAEAKKEAPTEQPEKKTAAE